MSIFRIHKTNNFTVMSNTHLRDKRLSLKAKGLLSIMFSLPNDWDYSINGLCKICIEKERAIKSTLKELKKFSYLKVTKLTPAQTKTGRIAYKYDIYETPFFKMLEIQDVQKQPVEFQPVENAPQLSTKVLITKNKILKKPKTLKDKNPYARARVNKYE